MAVEHHIREADRTREFWTLLREVAAGRAPHEVLADWLEDRGDPRAVIARNARPAVEQTDENPRYNWQREPYTAVEGGQVLPVPGVRPLYFHRGSVTLAEVQHPNYRRIRAGENGLDFETARPLLIWRQGPLTVHAPVSPAELHDFIDQLPEGRVKDEWRGHATFYGWDRPVKLARFGQLADARPFIAEMNRPGVGDTGFGERHHSDAARVLADHLADHGDPREHLVRENDPSPNAFQRAEQRSGWQYHRDPPRDVSYHQLPDHTRLSLTKVTGRKGTHWVALWENQGLRFRAIFTHPEFKEWLKKWPIDQLRNILRERHQQNNVKKLARMKAPAGGMIVNNQFQPGGQFLAKPMQKIRDAVARWKRLKLARNAELVDTRPFHDEFDKPEIRAAGYGDRHLSHAAGVLADRFADSNDPREDIVRNNFEGDDAWTEAERRSGGRSHRYVEHEFPDKTTLGLTKISGPNGTHWVVVWRNGRDTEPLNIRFRAVMSHPEFRAWLKKWPIDELRKLLSSTRRGALTKQSRKRTPEDPLPGHLEPAMYAAGFSPEQDALTPQQIEHIASAHGLPVPNLTKREDREKFFDQLVKVRQPHATLKKRLLDNRTDPDEVFAYMVPHMLADARAYAGHAGDWYGKDVDKMEKGARLILGFPLGSPQQTLLKALIAATSAGQEPAANVPNAIRIIEAGKAVDPRRPFEHLPPDQQPRLKAWLAEQNPIARHVGHTVAEHVRWWLAHGKANSAKAEYRSYPAYVTKDGDQLIAYEAPKSQELEPGEKRSGKLIVLPDMGKWLSEANKKNRRQAALPVPDENGQIQAKGWTQRDSAILASRLDDMRHIIHHFGGNLFDVQKWLLTDHPREEFEKVVGRPFEDKDEVLDPTEPVPGMFFLGPKFGAFALNLHQNIHPHLGKYLTADVWWTRTWNRFMGALRNTATGKARETPRGPRERRLMWAAAKIAAKEAGFRSVADLQANLWYHEQHLDRWFGGDASSTSVVDGINNALAQRGIKVKLQRTRSYWVSPAGEFHEVGDFGHEQFAKQQGEPGVAELQAKGWGRVVGAGGMLTFDRGMDRSPPNSRQLRALTDHAIENGYGHVWHGGTDRPLWSRPSDEPERLARKKPTTTLVDRLDARAQRLKAQGKLLPLGRLMHVMLHAADRVFNPNGIGKAKLARIDPKAVKQFSDAHVKTIESHVKAGGTISDALRDPTVHQIFADRLEDADDPRHEIVRRSISDHGYGLAPWSEGRARAIDIADGVPKGTTPDYTVRNPSRYAQLKRPDGEEMIVSGIPGKAGMGWHVHWGPPNAGLMGRYNAAFTGPELANLLRRMEPEDRAAIVKDLKRKQGPMRLSRVRELIDKHRANPAVLRQIAGSKVGPVASLLHHIANRLDMGHSAEQIEQGIDAWRKRRGWTDPVKLARPIINPAIPVEQWDQRWVHNGEPHRWGRQLHNEIRREPAGSEKHELAKAALVHGDMHAYRALIDHLQENITDSQSQKAFLFHQAVAHLMEKGLTAERAGDRIGSILGSTAADDYSDRATQLINKLRNWKRRGFPRKLARQKRFAHWMSPDGTLHQLGDTETHQEWADKRGESEESLKARGWSRIVPEGDTVYVDRDLQRHGSLNYRESRAVTDHAAEHGFKHVVLDGIRPRTLWSAD